MIRKSRLIKNIFGSAFYKGINILFGFLLVRFTIDFAGEEKYGIWLTLLSFFTWFSAIEVGIGNNFRNQITQYFTQQNFNGIQQTLAKAYKSLLLVYFTVILVLLISSLIFPIHELFLPDSSSYLSFDTVFKISATLYLTHFVFAFLNTVLLAVHKAATTFLVTAIQNGILLAGIIIFKQTDVAPSLSLLCIWFSAVPLFVWLVFSVGAYGSCIKDLKPDFQKAISKPTFGPLKKVNMTFFVIQLCTLIIFSTDNLIIVQFLSSSAEVARYNIVFKYFNIITVIFNLMLVPYWASFTEAAQQNNKAWIQKHIKHLITVLALLVLLGAIMIYFSDFAFNLWLGQHIEVSLILVIMMCVSVILTAWNNIFSYFLNSVGNTRLQATLLVISAILNIPLSIWLIELYGSAGVIIATVCALLPLSFALPFQYRMLLNKMKQG